MTAPVDLAITMHCGVDVSLVESLYMLFYRCAVFSIDYGPVSEHFWHSSSIYTVNTSAR